jgi:hypothetical protein
MVPLKVNSFISGSVAKEYQNLKEVNAWMTVDVVSWLKDTGQETIQNSAKMYDLPITKNQMVFTNWDVI